MSIGDYIQNAIDYLLKSTPEKIDDFTIKHPNMVLYRNLVNKLCNYKTSSSVSFFDNRLNDFSRLIDSGLTSLAIFTFIAPL